MFGEKCDIIMNMNVGVWPRSMQNHCGGRSHDFAQDEYDW